MTAPLSQGSALGAGSCESREWNINSDIDSIAPIVATVQDLCQAAGFSPRQCQLNIPVSITEALANAILCGNQGNRALPVHVAIALQQDRLVVRVTDQGPGLDPDVTMPSPADADWLCREDGRGLFLMRALMDDVHSERVATGGHTLKLTIRRA